MILNEVAKKMIRQILLLIQSSLYFQLVPVLSTIVAVTALVVRFETVSPEIVKAHEFIQSVPKHPLEFTVYRINAPGCSPNPLAKLIPTDGTR